MSRMRDHYRDRVVPALMEGLGYRNRLAVPRLEKIVVSMGLGKSKEEPKRLDAAVKDLATVTGQKPIFARARTSVSSFKLRKGDVIGCKVTLRGIRMFEFLDRLVSVVLPRIRDFQGLPFKSFDGKGNYSFGIAEQVVFPEINVEKVEFPQGMNISIVVRSRKPGDSRRLLEALGVPFERRN